VSHSFIAILKINIEVTSYQLQTWAGLSESFTRTTYPHYAMRSLSPYVQHDEKNHTQTAHDISTQLDLHSVSLSTLTPNQHTLTLLCQTCNEQPSRRVWCQDFTYPFPTAIPLSLPFAFHPYFPSLFLFLTISHHNFPSTYLTLLFFPLPLSIPLPYSFHPICLPLYHLYSLSITPHPLPQSPTLSLMHEVPWTNSITHMRPVKHPSDIPAISYETLRNSTTKLNVKL